MANVLKMPAPKTSQPSATQYKAALEEIFEGALTPADRAEMEDRRRRLDEAMAAHNADHAMIMPRSTEVRPVGKVEVIVLPGAT